MKFEKYIYGTKEYGTWIDLSLLLLRLYGGITMMSVGLDKLPLPPWMIDQVTQIGFPLPTFFAWLACFSEFAFGLLMALGLLTRISGFFLAFTMGVASFGFQGVMPIIDMHIAHHYVWTFVLFMAIGGGKWSIDYWISKSINEGRSSVRWIGLGALIALLAVSFYIEKTGEVNMGNENNEVDISSINIPGSFNNWDPSSNEMTTSDDINYSLDIPIQVEGLIQFKFTANSSWDVNFGEEERKGQGLPMDGTLEANADNIIVYIPSPGMYTFKVNKETFEYEVVKK